MATISYIKYVRNNPPREHAAPPGWLMDKWAEEKLTGGYNVKRSNICDRCWMAKSANGTCSC